ncbi:UNVERIFIED_CONTAM: hypothetical protein GTU68_053356, partial [Idotea baltica]|nr:hypothetical protein [Idotea baltica]
LIGILVFLLCCSAFFSSAETGLLSLNRYRLRYHAKSGNTSAQRVQRLLSRPDQLLGAILIGNNFVNILASAIATVVAIRLWGEAGIAIATVGLTLTLLIFGEITPKTLAALHPEKVAYPFSLPLNLLLKLLYPLVLILSGISNGLLKLFGVNVSNGSNTILTTEELRSVVRDSEHELPEHRQKMLLGILDLETVTINDVMVQRGEIQGINIDDDIELIIQQLLSTEHTRLPIYHHDINQIEGVTHIRQIAQLLTHRTLTKETLLNACVNPYFIPENTPLSTQLINFQQKKQHMGIIVDEYGDVIGMLTLEDILEEIVGDFTPQHHTNSPPLMIKDGDSYIIEGSTHIREINKALDWNLPCTGPKTFNGLMTEQLENIPDRPSCLKINEYYFEILASADNKAQTIKAWRTTPTDNLSYT